MNKKILFSTLLILTLLIAGCAKSPTSVYKETSIEKKSTESSFNAIEIVKEKIPSNMKDKMWYSKEWTQEKISNNEWKVTVSDAIWKVSTENVFCSQTGNMVSICSDNGIAKTYSNVEDYCKPMSLCQQEETAIQKETKTITTEQLKAKIQSALGSDPVNSLTNDNGIYEIKYSFEPLNNRDIDYGIVDDFAFRILSVFLKNNINDIKLIKIEVSTTTSIKSGIISKATITKEQFDKFAKDVFSINVEDFEHFTFDESFY